MLGIHNRLQKSIKVGVFPSSRPCRQRPDFSDVPDSLSNPSHQSDLLLFRLYRIQATASASVVRVCEQEAGLTRREWRVLAFVVQNEGMLSSVLADRAMLDRARTSRALTTLVAKKLVVRCPRPSNRREVQVFATDEGRATHDRLFARVAVINRQLLEGFSEAERCQMDAWLARLQEAAGRLRAGGEPAGS